MKTGNSRQKTSYLTLITLAATILFEEPVIGAYQLDNTFDCNTCIAEGSISCRPTYYDRYAFCCEPYEVFSRGCGGQDVYCSGYSTDSTMNTFSCPYEVGYCGASSSELEMHPESRNNLMIEIANSQFQDGALCYYQIYVNDENLDENNNMYVWDIRFESLTNVIVQLNNGADYENAGDGVSVSSSTGYEFQYEAPRNQVWISFTGSVQSGDADPAFKVSIGLRTFPKTSADDDSNEDASEENEPAPFYEWLDCYQSTGDTCGDINSINQLCFTTSYCEGVDFGDGEVIHWMDLGAISLASTATVLLVTALFI